VSYPNQRSISDIAVVFDVVRCCRQRSRTNPSDPARRIHVSTGLTIFSCSFQIFFFARLFDLLSFLLPFVPKDDWSLLLSFRLPLVSKMIDFFILLLVDLFIFLHEPLLGLRPWPFSFPPSLLPLPFLLPPWLQSRKKDGSRLGRVGVGAKPVGPGKIGLGPVGTGTAGIRKGMGINIPLVGGLGPGLGPGLTRPGSSFGELING
jgi:hypothetical protein